MTPTDPLAPKTEAQRYLLTLMILHVSSMPDDVANELTWLVKRHLMVKTTGAALGYGGRE